MTQAVLKVIRPLVRFGSALAPGAAGRAAFRLFCTPLGHAPVRDDNPAIRQARALFAEGRTAHIPYEHGFVRVTRFEPARPALGAVLVLHGWTGQGLHMAGFVRPLLAEGFRVAVMDLPAHGGSSGRRLTFPRAIAAIHAAMRDEIGPGGAPLAGMIGHSFGGAIALVAAAAGVAGLPPVPVRRLVTIAAPMGMAHYGRHFAETIGLTRRGHAAFEAAVQALTGRPMASFSGVDALRLTQIPTLVMHAPDDKEIPFAEAEALAAAGPRVVLRAMPGLGHRRILGAEAVHSAAAAFLARGAVGLAAG
ncbi:alpha/beta hydrolase [Rhabdaerophilum calidifontis]|uniref:alpha/beta hydrolase n=1 Tax=Rhabdaerophilum calidifontis TaxID=2604328 RepID=UPI00123AC114|nr:alpha/beta fold hydrolase [Rhabdaerophilum calidifontis]